MKIVITGATGYVGQYCLRYFLEQNYEVAVILRKKDDFISDFEGLIDIYIADITKPIEIDLPKEDKIDFLIHLAGANEFVSKDSSTAINSTVLGAKNVLDFCVRNNIKNTVYVSTVRVYGYNEEEIGESTEVKPNSDYSIIRLFAEQYFEMYQRLYGINYFIARSANLYGINLGKKILRTNLVPTTFCVDALEKQNIVLLSSGQQKMDFLYMNDLIKSVHYVMDSYDSYVNSKLNVTSGHEYTIIEIAKIVSEEYEKLYQLKCTTSVNSKKTSESSDISFNREKISNFGLHFEGVDRLREEIRKTFIMLNNLK